MVQTVASWLILAEVAHSISCNKTKKEALQLWVKASFPLNMQKIVNVGSYNLMVLFIEKRGGSH